MQSTKIRLRYLVSGMVAVALMAPGALAEEKGDKASAPHAGDKAPDFELKSTDGRKFKLSDHADKIVVLEWFNQDCPYSHMYKSGFAAGKKCAELAKKYAEKDVVWLAIDTTHYQTAKKNEKLRSEHKISYPILMDSDGTVGKKYGAKTTPHVFVINKGKIVYSGAFDNDPRKQKSSDDYRCYVDEALKAVLAGKELPLAHAKPWGCSVKYKK